MNFPAKSAGRRSKNSCITQVWQVLFVPAAAVKKQLKSFPCLAQKKALPLTALIATPVKSLPAPAVINRRRFE
jgi:hypothetical protein